MLSVLDRTFSRITLALSLVAMIALIAVAPSQAHQENPPRTPVELSCATNVFAQVLGATPVGDGSQTLILARLYFEPGGAIGAHTHPGTLIVTVESGEFGFTLVDHGDEMTINRGATATSEAASEQISGDELVVLNAGDWFVETGMVHTGQNLTDGTTTVLLTALIESGQPLTICADGAMSQHG